MGNYFSAVGLWPMTIRISILRDCGEFRIQITHYNEWVYILLLLYIFDNIKLWRKKNPEPLFKWQPSRYFILLASGHDITTTMKYEKLCLMYNIK